MNTRRGEIDNTSSNPVSTVAAKPALFSFYHPTRPPFDSWKTALDDYLASVNQPTRAEHFRAEALRYGHAANLSAPEFVRLGYRESLSESEYQAAIANVRAPESENCDATTSDVVNSTSMANSDLPRPKFFSIESLRALGFAALFLCLLQPVWLLLGYNPDGTTLQLVFLFLGGLGPVLAAGYLLVKLVLAARFLHVKLSRPESKLPHKSTSGEVQAIPPELKNTSVQEERDLLPLVDTLGPQNSTAIPNVVADDQLSKLYRLYSSGAITEEEFKRLREL